MTPRIWMPKKDPYLPPDHDDLVTYAVRAWKKGVASTAQQELLWDYWEYMCGTGDRYQDIVYRPGEKGDRDTTFAAAKQFPMLQIKKLLRPEWNPKAPLDGASTTDNPAKPAHIKVPKRKRRR